MADLMAINGSAQELEPVSDPVGALDEFIAESVEIRESINRELRRLAAAEQALLDEYSHRASEARARRDGYQRTLATLAGVDKVEASKSKPAAKQQGKRPWQASDAKMAVVQQRFLELFEAQGPLTASAIAAATPGLSAETCRRVLVTLRERQMVRKVRTGRGGGILYAPMPDANGD